MILEQLQNDLKEAQLNRDEVKVSTLRLLLSEIHNVEISKGDGLSEQDIILVIQKEVKKRQEAAAGFRTGGREESAQKEEAELKILKIYLPEGLSTEELTKLIEDSINELGAKSQSDMGRVIGSVMSKAQGRVEGGKVSSLVKESPQSSAPQ